MRRCVEVKKVRTNAQGHIWFSHINMMYSLFCEVLLVSFGFFSSLPQAYVRLCLFQ